MQRGGMLCFSVLVLVLDIVDPLSRGYEPGTPPIVVAVRLPVPSPFALFWGTP